MILHRLVSAIRHQNWSQIITEILIVVIGIFLGLQVQAWYEDRADRELEQLYLERVANDIDRDVKVYSGATNTSRNKQAALQLIQRSIKQVEIGEISKYDFLRFLTRSTSYGWGSPPTRIESFEEMKNTGRMTLIENVELRSEINSYYVSSANSSRRIDYRISGYSEALLKMVDPRAKVAARSLSEEDLNKIKNLSDPDKDEIIRNFLTSASGKEFMQLIIAEQNYTIFLIEQIESQLDSAIRLKEKLDQEIQLVR